MAKNDPWKRAALLKDRTRRAIRERRKAGESLASLADDYDVPELFVAALCAWQFAGDDDGTSPLPAAVDRHAGRTSSRRGA